nr:spore coat protein [uncultured Caproiciproducens sp.]
MALTEKELSAIEDQLSGEKLLVTKFKAYSQMCSDSEIKQKCDTIASQHQAHYDKLLSFLN